MSWLAPLYLAGLAAVTLPVLFHLLRRTPRGRQPFSAMMFLSPSPPRLARRSRLENLLLLFLRAAALVLLALAFARPFFREPVSLPVEEQGGRRVAILVDTSASMRRAGLWQQALDKVNQEFGELRPGDDAALYCFDTQPRAVVPFREGTESSPQQHLARLRSTLRQLAPASAASDLGKALVAVADDLHTTGDSRSAAAKTVRRLVLVSDLGQGSRLDAIQSYEWPEDVELAVEVVVGAKPTNAGLHLAARRAGESEPEQREAVRVRVTNDRDSQREQFALRWPAGDGMAAADQPTAVYVPPGESRVVRVPRPAGARESDRLVLAGDDHDFDNTLHLAPMRRERISLLYLGPDPPEDAKGLLYYLRRAFPSTAVREIRVLVRKPDEQIPADDLGMARLVVVGAAIGDPQAAVLRQRLQGGGTVLYVLIDAAAGKGLGQLMGRGDLAIEEAPAADYVMLGRIDFAHPLFAAMADPRFNDFTKIHFWKHRRVELGQTPGTQVLAVFDDGSPAIVEQAQGKGRLLLLTAGWQPADSQLARSSKFVPLLSAILERAGVSDTALPQYQVGDTVSLGAWSLSQTGATVVKPDGTEVGVPRDAGTFGGTDQPGVYRVRAGGKEERFAVNLAPSESQTAPMPLEQLEQHGVRMGDRRSRADVAAAQRQMHSAELENSQKLWRWLLAAALGVLIVETWHAGGLARRVTRQNVPG